jgi:hypothetical protein
MNGAAPRVANRDAERVLLRERARAALMRLERLRLAERRTGFQPAALLFNSTSARRRSGIR